MSKKFSITNFFGLPARGVNRGGLRRGLRGIAMPLNPLLIIYKTLGFKNFSLNLSLTNKFLNSIVEPYWWGDKNEKLK